METYTMWQSGDQNPRIKQELLHLWPGVWRGSSAATVIGGAVSGHTEVAKQISSAVHLCSFFQHNYLLFQYIAVVFLPYLLDP